MSTSDSLVYFECRFFVGMWYIYQVTHRIYGNVLCTTYLRCTPDNSEVELMICFRDAAGVLFGFVLGTSVSLFMNDNIEVINVPPKIEDVLVVSKVVRSETIDDLLKSSNRFILILSKFDIEDMIKHTPNIDIIVVRDFVFKLDTGKSVTYAVNNIKSFYKN